MLAYIVNESEIPFSCAPGINTYAKEPSEDTAAI